MAAVIIPFAGTAQWALAGEGFFGTGNPADPVVTTEVAFAFPAVCMARAGIEAGGKSVDHDTNPFLSTEVLFGAGFPNAIAPGQIQTGSPRAALVISCAGITKGDGGGFGLRCVQGRVIYV